MRVLALTSALRPRTRKTIIADTPKYKTTSGDRARRGQQPTTLETTDTTNPPTPPAADPPQSTNTDDLDTTTPYNQSGVNTTVTTNPTDDTILPEINQAEPIDPIPELNADKFDPNQTQIQPPKQKQPAGDARSKHNQQTARNSTNYNTKHIDGKQTRINPKK